MGIDQRLAHQHLVGDAVVAGDDLVQDAVDVVARQRHDGPGVGERGVAGAADQPGIDQRDAGAGRAVALGRERGHQAARPRADHQHVGVDQNAVELVHSPAHHGRGRFFTDGCTSTICSGQKISQLKQVMQCSRNLMTGSSLVWREPRDLSRDRLRLHVDHVGRADHVADAATGAFFELDAFDHAVS